MSESKQSEVLGLVFGLDAARRAPFYVVCRSGLVWEARVPPRWSPEITATATRIAAEMADAFQPKSKEDQELESALLIAQFKHHPEESARFLGEIREVELKAACEAVTGCLGMAPEGLEPGVYKPGISPDLDCLEVTPLRGAYGVSNPSASPPIFDVCSFEEDMVTVAKAAKEVEGIASRLRAFQAGRAVNP